MANFKDAMAGWELFQSADYSLSLDEINAELKRLGSNPVSPRTYAHYNKLVRHGYENYIPINQLDVKTLEDPVWDLALRNRYFTWETRLGVRLEIMTSEGTLVLMGTANRLSEATASIRIEKRDRPATDVLKRRNPLFIHFLENGERRFAEVESVTQQMRSGITTLRVFFPTLAPIESVLHRTSLPISQFRITVFPVEEDRYFTRVVQHLYWLFQTVESARLIAEEVLSSLDSERKFAISSPRVTTLQVASPLEVIIGVVGVVGIAVDATVGRYLKHRKTFWEGSKLSQEAKALQWENERKKALASISTEEIIDQMVDRLSAAMAREGASASKDMSSLDREKVDSLNRKQLQKSVGELADTSFDIQVEQQEGGPDI